MEILKTAQFYNRCDGCGTNFVYTSGEIKNNGTEIKCPVCEATLIHNIDHFKMQKTLSRYIQYVRKGLKTKRMHR